MPYQIDWLIPDRVLVSYITDPFMTEETLILDEMIVELLDASSSDQVHIIAVDLNSKFIPLNIIAKMKYPKHPKLSWVVNMKTANPIMQLVFKFGSQLFSVRLHFVNSFEEALQFLQDIDSTLPDLTPYQSYLNKKAQS